ncbi:MAG: glycoside hydrolase family 38 C-terminal domain-containing protein [Lentisphaeria bacterium]|nr:glycoside hydrolase family 38 C-terminal domain-containing protein [Lentisphaeria bacterium]
MICDKKRELYLQRIEQFRKRISEMIVGPTVEMEASFSHSVEPTPFDRRLGLTFTPIKQGGKWGDVWESAWFRLKGTVPTEWQGRKVVAQLDFNGEALIFGEDGTPLQGLANQTVYTMNWSRDTFPLFDSAKGGEEVALWVEAAANHTTGVRNVREDIPRGTPERYGTYVGKVNKIRLAVFDDELKQLSNDFFVLSYLYKALPEKSTRAVRILRGLSDAVDAFADNPDNAPRCRDILRPLLEQKANASSITATAVGHAHIDTGWLWPVREAKRKCARSFSNQIALIEQYPDYVFGASQPAHYAMIKEHYPKLYAKIKQAVKHGSWEPQGGMWVEADCNLISGESMVRQFIHGKNFFNVLTLYEDRPNANDAWDIDIFYEEQAMETARVVSTSSLGAGKVRQGMRFDLTVGQSTLTQKVHLDANSKRLDFRTTVNWRERHRMLRVAFPTVIRSDHANFDIQYGYTQRNTHRNVSWDMARFEVAAHKYADLSDNCYGVALLNDCKYGYKVLDNVLDLNLLRSPTEPDPDADFDHHEFTYSLLPHHGNLIASDVQEQAIQLNQPPAVFVGHKAGAATVPVTVSGKGASLEVLKKAEKEDCLVIRLVERLGCETTATVDLTDATATLVETNLLEWKNLQDLGSGRVEVAMKPFEIRTFKILNR